MKIGFCSIDLICLIILAVIIVVMLVLHTRLNREKQELVDAISEQYANNTISINGTNEK